MAKIGEAVDVYLTGATEADFLTLDDGNPVVLYHCHNNSCPDYPDTDHVVIAYQKGWTASDIDPTPWIDWTYYGSFAFIFVLAGFFVWVGFRYGYSVIFPENGKK